MKYAVAAALIIHGLITASQSTKCFSNIIPVGIKNPSWLNWWPINLGRSWILSLLGLEKIPFIRAGGVLWLIGGIILILAGLGVLGIIIPPNWSYCLTFIGVLISLFMLLIYIHPLFVFGIGMGIIILLGVLRLHWPIL